ncbi:MAG TPA: hypothetical protein VN324_14875, partial [Quisquiliibacterium sp.]|nr:hypothetical protein [Quisquiliibacterium sp.]
MQRIAGQSTVSATLLRCCLEVLRLKHNKGFIAMKLTHGLAVAITLSFAAMTAQAEITGTLGAVS